MSRIYAAEANNSLIKLLTSDIKRVLDVGCGAGGNAALIKRNYPHAEIYGVTYSHDEAALASQVMESCCVADIEANLPTDLLAERFDVLIFSHVLEHMREPARVLAKFVVLLKPGGQVLIAVPNVLSCRMRMQFLFGHFEYQSGGVLDDTHLRFFTYNTADSLLIKDAPSLQITSKVADGSVPLWLLRRYILPEKLAKAIDEWGCRYWPNLFGGQILISAVKK